MQKNSRLDNVSEENTAQPTKAKTLYQKIWERHVIDLSQNPQAPAASENRHVLFIDLHLIHEVTSPQAFEGLRLAGRKVRHPELTVATMDHNTPTDGKPVNDPISAKQMQFLENNCKEFGITLYKLGDYNQGVVHVIGPELGLTLPGKTIVCGDSHTATHGAFGALAFGIGTSEVEHVLATQTLVQNKSKTMKVEFSGKLQKGVYAKDMVLALIGKIGTAGATGYVIEYCGEAIENLSIEGRMTICNMSIEAGARAGMIAPDQKTFDYVQKANPSEVKDWQAALQDWQTLRSDPNAVFDKVIKIDCNVLAPQISWGTSPGMVMAVDQKIPVPAQAPDEVTRQGWQKALQYMDLQPNNSAADIQVDHVFIGSCTNSRIEDLREAAAVIRGRKKSESVKQVLVVPGSHRVKDMAEAEGLHKIFLEAGFEWRQPGCSMCLAMNNDVLKPLERCASTSNRNFEGRQGKGSRTHLVSPAMAALSAIHGHFVDAREEI